MEGTADRDNTTLHPGATREDVLRHIKSALRLWPDKPITLLPEYAELLLLDPVSPP